MAKNIRAAKVTSSVAAPRGPHAFPGGHGLHGTVRISATCRAGKHYGKCVKARCECECHRSGH